MLPAGIRCPASAAASRPYLKRAAETGRSQVAAIGVAQEMQRVFIARKRDTDPARCPQFSFDKKDRRVTVFCFCLWDAGFGPAFIKVCTYCPWPVKIWVNGHEWAKQQARKVGLGFTELSNGFAAAGDPALLQRICDALQPGTRQALHEGIIDACKAQVIAEATRCLDAAAAAAAEAAIVPDRVTGKTPGQIRAEIARAVLKADPAAARQRREQAQKDARVELWREDAGTAAIVSFGLPPDEALAADQQITSRALDLKAAGVPGSMNALRVRAYLDALLGQDTAARYQTTASQPSNNSPSNDSPSNDSPSNDSPSDDGPRAGDGDGPHSESGAPAGNRTPGDSAAPEQPSGTGPDDPPPAPIRPAAKINLTIPLATLLGLAEHPGEATGFGPIDATLARTLATQAAGHPATTWCITVTDPDGHPIAHGCARKGRSKRKTDRRTRPPAPGNQPSGGNGPPGGTGPPGGYRTWRLRSGRRGRLSGTGQAGLPELTVDLEPIPVSNCDHRHQTSAHDPSDRLRHLVEIRDGTCNWPPCQREAARCDYEHTIAFDNGGLTCACNGGPMSVS